MVWPSVEYGPRVFEHVRWAAKASQRGSDGGTQTDRRVAQVSPRLRDLGRESCSTLGHPSQTIRGRARFTGKTEKPQGREKSENSSDLGLRVVAATRASRHPRLVPDRDLERVVLIRLVRRTGVERE